MHVARLQYALYAEPRIAFRFDDAMTMKVFCQMVTNGRCWPLFIASSKSCGECRPKCSVEFVSGAGNPAQTINMDSGLQLLIRLFFFELFTVYMNV